MKRSAQLLALSAAALMLLSGMGCDKLKARSELNAGVKAYKDRKTRKTSALASRRSTSTRR